MSTIPSNIDKFLSQTMVAVISTVDADGCPRSAPIWYHWEDGSAYMFTGRRTLKWRNIMRNSAISLCVDWREPPYKSVILGGVAEETRRPLYDLVLSMAVRYYGDVEGRAFAEDYREQSENTVIFRLTPSRVADYTESE